MKPVCVLIHCAVLLGIASAGALAQPYPAKPVRIVVPFLAGGAVDTTARVLAQKATARPAPGEPRRTLNPRVAGRDTWKRIEALGRIVELVRSYRITGAARCAGDAHAVFPPGTYLLRVMHGVPCAASG